MHHLYDRINDLKLHRSQLEEDAERKLEKDQVKQVSGTMLSAMADAKSKGLPFDFSQALTPEQLKNLPPAVVQAVTQTASQQLAFSQQVKNVKDENTRHDVLQDGASNYVLGKLTPEQQVTFTDLLLQAGGHHDFATLVQTKRQLEDMQWPQESSPSVLGSVATAIGSGDMNGRDGIDKLVAIATNRQLSARDFREFSFLLLGRMNRGDVSFDREVLGVGLGAVKELIRDKRADQLGIESGDRESLTNDSVFRGSANKAQNEYLFAHEAMTQDPKWAGLPTAEKQQKSQNLIDSIAKKYGGYTQSEGEAATAKRLAQEEKSRQDAAAKAAAKKAGPDIVWDKAIKSVAEQGDPALKNVDSAVQSALKISGLSETDIAPNPDKKPGIGPISWSQHYSTPELGALVEIQHANMGERGQAAVEATGEAGAVYAARAQQKLLTLRGSALVAAQSMGKTIQEGDYAARIQLTSTDIARNGFATPQQRQILKYLWTQMREYALIRQRAGYTVDEVKEMGKDAYLRVPLFGTPADVIDNGPAVGKALGLSPQQAGQMMIEQQALIRNLLNP